MCDTILQNYNLKYVIRSFAESDPAATAILSSKYDPLTYSQLIKQIDYVAGMLKQSGFGKSARIGIAVKDAAPAALAIISIACSAVAVPLDQNLAEAEIEMRMKLLSIDAVCVLSGQTTVAGIIAERLGIEVIELISKNKNELGFSMSSPKNKVGTLHDPTMECMAVILQTSGTTAEPKLVPCLHSGLLATAEHVRGWFSLGKNDRCLSVAPPCFSQGLTLTILAPLLSGGSVAFPSNPNCVDIMEWFEKLSPTWFSAVPTMLLAVSEMLASYNAELRHRLRFVTYGGGGLPESVRSCLQSSLGIDILEHYGTTETGQISANLASPGQHKSGTVGIPPAGTVMVVSGREEKLPQGEQGEIIVCGPNVMPGYLNGRMMNEKAFHQGWFRTGDIGSIDKDGFLTIRGRIKEVINRGGEKISPYEVEATMLKHSDIVEAAAFAVPHPRLGEDVAAAVVLRNGAALSADEFRSFMSARLSWSKVPRRVHIVKSIPKGPGGKVQRNRLGELLS